MSCIFYRDMAEMPCSYIEILTIVGQEDTSQFGSLLAVGLGPISNGHTFYTSICIRNSRIYVLGIMT